MTTHEEYAIDVFEVQPFQFIKKPVDEEKFVKYFLQVEKELSSQDVFYHYTFNKVHYKKLVKDIAYFHSEKRIIRIVDKNGKEEQFTGKLNEVEKQLQGVHRFLRIHQSYLIHYDYISQISAGKIELRDGKVMSISPDRAASVSSDYARFVRSEKCQ